MSTEQPMPPVRRVPHSMLAALATPALPMAMMTLPLTIFLPAFYAATIGINLAAVGIVFTVVRLADLVFDPLVGGLMDRTSTRWGRFRPWMIIGTPIVMLGAGSLFMVRPGVGAGYLAMALTFTYVGYSIVVLSQMGLGALMSPFYEERSRVFAWWQFFNMMGIFLALALPAGLAIFMPLTAKLTVRTMGISVLLSTPVTVLIAICFVREPHSPPVRHVAKLRDYLALLRLRSARLALSSVAMTGFSIGISSSVFVFYYTIVKAIPMATVNIVLGFLFAVTISSIPVWTKIGNRIGKHRALTLGCTISCLYMAAMWLMPPGNLTYMICLFAIGGFAGASADLFPRAMMADVSDEDHLITGMDRTAMLYALLALVTKLGQATAIGVVFVMLDLFGFKASLGLHNSARALTGVLLLGSLVPSLLHVGAALFAWRYPLTAERHAAIRTELDHQRPGYDPEAKPRTICHDTLGAVLAAPRG